MPKRLQLAFTIAFCLSCRSARAADFVVVHDYFLGTSPNGQLNAKILFYPDMQMDQPGGFGEFHIRFYTKKRNHLRQIADETIGSGILAKTPIKSGAFLGTGRKQIFISTEMGTVTTHLFDFTGARVRTLYSNEYIHGRVWVSLAKDKSGHVKIIEDQGRNTFNDKNLGVGYAIGDKLIRRTLHWNGRRFAPDFPGRTRIQPLASKRKHDHVGSKSSATTR